MYDSTLLEAPTQHNKNLSSPVNAGTTRHWAPLAGNLRI